VRPEDKREVAINVQKHEAGRQHDLPPLISLVKGNEASIRYYSLLLLLLLFSPRVLSFVSRSMLLQIVYCIFSKQGTDLMSLLHSGISCIMKSSEKDDHNSCTLCSQEPHFTFSPISSPSTPSLPCQLL
jgi:hypothetical protein